MRKDPTEFRERFKKWQSGEKVYEAGLPKCEDGKESVRVGDYNVYPSAIGASELDVTTPEIVITGKDKRPLYQRYAAERSTYDPELITNFTGLIPGIGEVQDATMAVDAYNKGDYLSAGILGAGLLLPNALEKPLKVVGKSLKNVLLDYKFANAIKKKHIQTLKQLRDDHFLNAATNTAFQKDGKPITLYHGTPTKGWHKYEEKYFGSNTDSGYYGKGLYLSENPNHASIYKENGELKELYLNAVHPFYSGQLDIPFKEATFRGNLSAWFNQPGMKRLAEDEAGITTFLDETQKQKILKDFFDSDVSSHVEKGIQEHIAVPLSQMMKYKAPIVRDDSGKLIRLSKRDDFLNPDFRY